MASNAPDDGQTNTSTLSITRSNPTVPTDLQHASDYSLDGNTDASTADHSQSRTTTIWHNQSFNGGRIVGQGRRN